MSDWLPNSIAGTLLATLILIGGLKIAGIFIGDFVSIIVNYEFFTGVVTATFINTVAEWIDSKLGWAKKTPNA